MQKTSVLIIGAGAAGLMAANELAADHTVTVLEAQSRIGGRIHSISSGKYVIEGGSEFIHGDLAVTMGLLKKAGYSALPVKGKMYRKENGAFIEQEEMIEGWDDLLKKMKRLEQDTTMDKFLETYFGQETQAAFRKHILNFTEGFDIADPAKVSVKSLYKEWAAGEGENYRLPHGYGSLALYLQQQAESKGCTILTGKTIKKVVHVPGHVTLLSDEGEEFHADKLLITVSLGILQSTGKKGSLFFSPPIPQYITAAQNIGFGQVVKVILHFNEIFWQSDAAFIFSDEIFPTWWPGNADGHFMTGWAGGSKGDSLSGETDEVILKKALASLAAIFDMPVARLAETLQHAAIFNWHKNEYTAGAYSYATLTTDEARTLFNTPIAETLFFAGEGLYTGEAPGTVEAALISGKEAAKKIRKASHVSPAEI
jgi:monoamine oxidase